MGGERMPKRVTRGVLGDTRFFDGGGNGSLQVLLVKMMAAHTHFAAAAFKEVFDQHEKIVSLMRKKCCNLSGSTIR